MMMMFLVFVTETGKNGTENKAKHTEETTKKNKKKQNKKLANRDKKRNRESERQRTKKTIERFVLHGKLKYIYDEMNVSGVRSDWEVERKEIHDEGSLREAS